MSKLTFLKKPLKICNKTVKNRIVVPAMSDFGMTLPDGKINARHIEHYKKYSLGGAGLIITEACAVSKVRIPVICVGEISDGEQAEKILKDGCADMTAVGRGHLCNPDWANKVFEGVTPKKCRSCKVCLWYKDGRLCPVYKNKF